MSDMTSDAGQTPQQDPFVATGPAGADTPPLQDPGAGEASGDASPLESDLPAAAAGANQSGAGSGQDQPGDTRSSGGGDQTSPGDRGAIKDPEDWTTGDEPVTGAQASYLATLAREAGEDVPDGLTKAQASELIDQLQRRTGRGQ